MPPKEKRFYFVCMFVKDHEQVSFFFQMENLDSSLTELKSHLAETNKDLGGLNNTVIREVKSFNNHLSAFQPSYCRPVFDRTLYRPTNQPTYRLTEQPNDRLILIQEKPASKTLFLYNLLG